MRPAPECPSCGRPAAPGLSSCPYCSEALPPPAIHRVTAAAAALAAIAVAVCVPHAALAAIPQTFARMLPTPQFAAFVSAAAILSFAPFPAALPGLAGTGRPRLLRELALRSSAFVLILFATVLAAATFNP